MFKHIIKYQHPNFGNDTLITSRPAINIQDAKAKFEKDLPEAKVLSINSLEPQCNNDSGCLMCGS